MPVTGKSPVRSCHPLACTRSRRQPPPIAMSLLALHLDQVVPILGISIGPVILISGVGLLLLSLTNRYGRVIDRSRVLGDALRRSGNRDPHVWDQIGILRQRAKLLRSSITLVTVSVLCAAILVIGIFIGSILGMQTAVFIVIMFCTCLASLVTGLGFFITDVNRSLAALDLDMDDVMIKTKP